MNISFNKKSRLYGRRDGILSLNFLCYTLVRPKILLIVEDAVLDIIAFE
jgi:hypothetical protein